MRARAWFASGVAHVVAVLLAAAIFAWLAPRRAAVVEPDRTIGVVIVRPQPSRHDESLASDADTEPLASAVSSPYADNLAAALPSEAAAPAPPSFLAAGAILAADAPVNPTGWLATPGDLGGSARGRTTALAGDGELDPELIAELQRAARRPEPTGPATAVSIFGSPPAPGRSFVFVIDRSHSMGGSGLGMLLYAEREFAAAIANLGSEHQFAVIAYNQFLAYFPERGFAPGEAPRKELARRFVGSLAALGGTEHDKALLAATRLAPDVIFFLTDGEPELTAAQIRLLATRCAGRTAIHCVQFERAPPAERPHSLEVLAERTGGSYTFVDVARLR